MGASQLAAIWAKFVAVMTAKEVATIDVNQTPRWDLFHAFGPNMKGFFVMVSMLGLLAFVMPWITLHVCSRKTVSFFSLDTFSGVGKNQKRIPSPSTISIIGISWAKLWLLSWAVGGVEGYVKLPNGDGKRGGSTGNAGTLRKAVSDWIAAGGASNSAVYTTYGPIEGWDTSEVTNMAYVFDGNKYDSSCPFRSFNTDLSKWDVSKVTSMEATFWLAGQFNADLSKWDVSKVTSMEKTFAQAGQFNRDLSKWNTDKVTTFSQTFKQAKQFNADISKWNTSTVTRMDGMFNSCDAFNADISKWDVSKVDTITYMFVSVKVFNRDLSKWAKWF
jgi:surface protein